MQDEHVSLPKTRVQLAQMEDDDDNVFATSLIDKYAARPNELQNMCLATFAVTYNVATSSPSLEQNEDINIVMDNLNNDNSENPKIMMLKDGLGQMRKRKQESIYYKQNDTRFIQNQKSISMQNFCYITHGHKKMNSFQGSKHMRILRRISSILYKK